MTLRKPSKSGLAEALRASSQSPRTLTPADAPGSSSGPVQVIWCGGRGCEGNKVSKRYLNGRDGAFEWVTERASSAEQRLIDITQKNGRHLGFLCQECYDKWLYKTQHGRLSHVFREDMEKPEAWVGRLKAYDPTDDRMIEKELNPRAAPQSSMNFRRHLSEIDALADRMASQHSDNVHDREEDDA